MKFDTKEFSRRTFIKGSLAAGAALGLGTLWTSRVRPFRRPKPRGRAR